MAVSDKTWVVLVTPGISTILAFLLLAFSINQVAGADSSWTGAANQSDSIAKIDPVFFGDETRLTKIHSNSEKSHSRVSIKPSKPTSKTKDKTSRHRHGTAPCLAWVDRSKPIQGVIVCVHGLGLHNGTYEPFGKRMSELGYATYSIDVRGFGSWMENKGKETVEFDECLNDVRTTLKVVRRAHPGLPVFLLGESMGGAIALRVTSLYPELVDGLISSVPAGDRFKQAKTSLKVALHLINNPDKPINVGEGVVKQATQKEELRKAWLEDPLARLKLSPRELHQFQKFMNGNHDCARNIKETPVLIIQGCKDKLVRPEGTVELFNNLATPDREIVLIPNGEHLIFEEEQFTDQEIAMVKAWMDARLKNSPTKTAPLPNFKTVSQDNKSEKAEGTSGDLK